MKFSLRTLLGLTALVACVAGVVTCNAVPGEVADIRGIEVLSDTGLPTQATPQRIKFLFNDSVQRKHVWQLFSFLSERGSIFFYDAEHKQISDPGAYVTIERVPGEAAVDLEFIARYANHGWSSDWFPISRREAVEYLWMCHEANSTERTHNMLDDGMTFKVAAPPIDKNGKRLKVEKRKTNADKEYGSAVFLRERIKSVAR